MSAKLRVRDHLWKGSLPNSGCCWILAAAAACSIRLRHVLRSREPIAVRGYSPCLGVRAGKWAGVKDPSRFGEVLKYGGRECPRLLGRSHR
jgi:hypothetical protein